MTSPKADPRLTQRWSAWCWTDPQGANHGDAVEHGSCLTRKQAEAIVRESRRGGFVKETAPAEMEARWWFEWQPSRDFDDV